MYKPSTHGAKTLFRQEKPLQTEIAPLLSWRTVEPSTAKPLPRSQRQRITNGRLDKFFYALTQAGWERRRGPPTALCVCVSYMCTAFVLMGRGFLLPPPPPPSFPLSPSCFCLTPARSIVRAASNGPPLCAIQRRSFSSMRIFFPQSNTASEGKIHRALIATDNKLFPGDLRSR